MNAAAYVRVSSKAQTLDMQRAAIERAAATRGDEITTWYAERTSAKTIERDELKRLRSDVRAGAVTRLYVFRLDRLARSGIRDTFEVVEELKRHGTELVTVSDGFSIEGPAAEIVLAVMAWAAKMERLAIGERISAARERKEAAGGAWGRPRRMDGPTSARVRELARKGHSVRTVAQLVGVPRATVQRCLKNPAPF